MKHFTIILSILFASFLFASTLDITPDYKQEIQIKVDE